jgi:hypothetical protein
MKQQGNSPPTQPNSTIKSSNNRAEEEISTNELKKKVMLKMLNRAGGGLKW